MNEKSAIDQAMIQAYNETHYSVAALVPFILQPGLPSAGLLDAYRQSGTTCSAYITACNPYSAAVDEKDNTARQAALANELRQRSLHFIEGVGRHPSGDWPGEPSFLILGLSLEAARSIGKVYEQNAILWCDSYAVPQLILLR